jgi:hypothetical protein
MALLCEKRSAPFAPDSHSFVLGDTLNVRIAETWADASNRISVRLDSVAEDSRCPLNLECFWQGNAKAILTCASGTGRAIFGLNTYPGFLQDTTVFGRSIKLLDVMPYPVWKTPIPKEDYSVKLVVN